MRQLMLGLAALLGFSACGSDVIVGEVGSASAGAGVLGAAGKPSALVPASGGTGGAAAGAGGSKSVGGSSNSAGARPAAAGATSTGNAGGAPPAVSGAPGAGGTGTGSAGTVSLPEEIPLIPMDGRINGDNALQIHGALFVDADHTTEVGLMSDFSGTNACISGVAARVQTMCTVTPPATDCYGMYFGAFIGLNLNQSYSPSAGYGEPLPFDASALRGFSFELSGDDVPGPNNLRFAVQTSDAEFCNVQSTKIRIGVNTLLFSDLLFRCYNLGNPPNPSAESAQRVLVKLTWAVLTNTSGSTPFNFCISNIRALRK